MTRNEAVKAMLEGKKVTHRYFSMHEYLFMKYEVITTEDGYKFNHEFYSREMFNDGWRLYYE
ncbi:hypothetical protein NU597_004405 [Salmonella enterica]|nr:hypothetical protein [Salmonella enterica]EJP0904555.1 hypothetical protein [Salmonella enterica]EJP1088911.1 hypothetical protein [Salmonella enterica]ELI5798210.1 hypothetical protein [Salmonella enterica]